MALKTDIKAFKSARDVDSIGRALQPVLAEAKAQTVVDIPSSAGALSRFEEKAAIEISASGQGLIGGGWSVQIYVEDQGEEREITLVALGDGGFARAMGGARNTVSLASSMKKRDQILTALNRI